MKDGLGSIRTDIQRQGGGAVAAAGERGDRRGCARGWDRRRDLGALARGCALQARPRAASACSIARAAKRRAAETSGSRSGACSRAALSSPRLPSAAPCRNGCFDRWRRRLPCGSALSIPAAHDPPSRWCTLRRRLNLPAGPMPLDRPVAGMRWLRRKGEIRASLTRTRDSEKWEN